MKLLTSVISLFILLKTSYCVDVICNEFGFFCADDKHFGTCVDYANGTVIADLIFLTECPYSLVCNVKGDPICAEATATSNMSQAANPTAANVHPPQGTNTTNTPTPASTPAGVPQADQTSATVATQSAGTQHQYNILNISYHKVANILRKIISNSSDQVLTLNTPQKETQVVANSSGGIKEFIKGKLSLIKNIIPNKNDTSALVARTVDNVSQFFKQIFSYFYRPENVADNGTTVYHPNSTALLRKLEHILQKKAAENGSTLNISGLLQNSHKNITEEKLKLFELLSQSNLTAFLEKLQQLEADKIKLIQEKAERSKQVGQKDFSDFPARFRELKIRKEQLIQEAKELFKQLRQTYNISEVFHQDDSLAEDTAPTEKPTLGEEILTPNEEQIPTEIPTVSEDEVSTDGPATTIEATSIEGVTSTEKQPSVEVTSTTTLETPTSPNTRFNYSAVYTKTCEEFVQTLRRRFTDLKNNSSYVHNLFRDILNNILARNNNPLTNFDICAQFASEIQKTNREFEITEKYLFKLWGISLKNSIISYKKNNFTKITTTAQPINNQVPLNVDNNNLENIIQDKFSHLSTIIAHKQAKRNITKPQITFQHSSEADESNDKFKKNKIENIEKLKSVLAEKYAKHNMSQMSYQHSSESNENNNKSNSEHLKKLEEKIEKLNSELPKKSAKHNITKTHITFQHLSDSDETIDKSDLEDLKKKEENIRKLKSEFSQKYAKYNFTKSQITFQQSSESDETNDKSDVEDLKKLEEKIRKLNSELSKKYTKYNITKSQITFQHSSESDESNNKSDREDIEKLEEKIEKLKSELSKKYAKHNIKSQTSSQQSDESFKSNEKSGPKYLKTIEKTEKLKYNLSEKIANLNITKSQITLQSSDVSDESKDKSDPTNIKAEKKIEKLNAKLAKKNAKMEKKMADKLNGKHLDKLKKQTNESKHKVQESEESKASQESRNSHENTRESEDSNSSE